MDQLDIVANAFRVQLIGLADECGGHFAYDWATMRITTQRAALTRRQPGLGEVSESNEVSQGERLLPQVDDLALHREAEASRCSR